MAKPATGTGNSRTSKTWNSGKDLSVCAKQGTWGTKEGGNDMQQPPSSGQVLC